MFIKKIYIMEEQISGGPMMSERETPKMDESYPKEYIPNKQQILRDYEINIRFLSVGCVIRMGCKEIPFTNVGDAMVELNKYVSNPYEEGKRWNTIFDSAE
jgi:hypothetical protein